MPTVPPNCRRRLISWKKVSSQTSRQGGALGKVKDIADAQQQRGLNNLKYGVSISVQLNEAVTSSAEMIRDTREVDNRSQAIAAAAEEMVASVNEISRNTESAAEESRQARTTAEQGIQAAERAEIEQVSLYSKDVLRLLDELLSSR